MSKKNKIEFYEGLYAIQFFWLFICISLMIVSLIYAICNNGYYYIPLIILFAYAAIAFSNILLARKFLRKILIDEKGIIVTKKGKDVFNSLNEIASIEIEFEKFLDVLFTYEIFFWIIRLSYLKIKRSDGQTISLLIQNKHKKYIDEACKNNFM